MIKSKGILTISIISLFAVESAYAAIASSGYVDQQVETRISEVAAAETGEGNVVSSISAEGNTVTATKGITAEETANKVNTIRTDGTATDTAYPSEKAVATALESKADADTVGVLTNLGTSNKINIVGAVNEVNSKVNSSIHGVANDDSDGAFVSRIWDSNGIILYSLADLPVASVETLGGIKSGSELSVDAYGKVSVLKARTAEFDAAGNNIAETYQKKDALVTSQNFDSNSATASDEKYTSEKAVATALDAKQDKVDGDILTNTATGSGSLSTGGATASSAAGSVALGNAANANGGSAVAVGAGSSASAKGATALGSVARADGQSSLAVGGQSQATKPGSTAVGPAASSTGTGAVALGGAAKSQADYAIQLGAGTNSEANTLSVGLSDANNYKLLGSDGKIPAERLPFEGDVLTNTATGSYSFSTGNASPASAGSAVAIGENATVQNVGTAIGYLTSSGVSGVALGARASSNKIGGVSVGSESAVEGDRGIAVGTGAQSAGDSSISIGVGAGALSNYAIQLGAGTNSEANTFSVGFGSGKNYKLLGSDGKVPADRLPVANASSLGGVKSGGDISISSTGAVSVVSALKAVQDANGANIAATYATKNSVEDLQANKVKVDWTTSNVNKVLVIGSDSNYPDVYGKVTVARITENFLDDAIQNKLDTAVTNVTSSGTGSVIGGFSKSGNTMTVTRTNVQIPVGSATATSYASIWVE